MNIERLNELLNARHTGAFARVAHSIQPATGRTLRKVKVEVTYTPNGKVYTYTGTIQDVALKLGLAPEIDQFAEARRVIDTLRAGGECVSLASSDTVQHILGSWQSFKCGKRGADEFGRSLTHFQPAVQS